MPQISSPHNARLREIRRLSRRRQDRERAGRFVAEGEDLLASADAHGWTAIERYAADGSGLPGVTVAPELLAAASELGSGTRALAVYPTRYAPAPVGPLAVYLHGVRDPGNIGTVLRGAEAFGAACVVLGPGCADPFGPKAVRASMGAIFAVPVARAGALGELPGTTIALDARAERSLAEVCASHRPPAPGRNPQPLSLLVGGERAGLPQEILEGADERARIPIATDSLNAAMAATVALYELTRMAAG
jgi:TrmH family RNA methyltransferase